MLNEENNSAMAVTELTSQTEDSADVTETGGLSLTLANFTGPLDLLLHLVKEAKIEIKDIFVSEVTSQFLLYMSELSSVDVAKASEYMDMAATLIEIKSRSLLPKFEVDEVLEETPEQILIRQLEEYKMFKELSEKLKVQENVNRLYKTADESVGNVRLVAKDMSLDGLLDAYANILCRMDKTEAGRQPKEILRDKFNVADKILYIQDELRKRGVVSFFSLFDETVTVSEVVVTFSAVLELLKFQYVMINQFEFFGDIDIRQNPDFREDTLFLEAEGDELAEEKGQAR